MRLTKVTYVQDGTRREADRQIANNRQAAADHRASAAYPANYGSKELPTSCAECEPNDY